MYSYFADPATNLRVTVFEFVYLKYLVDVSLQKIFELVEFNYQTCANRAWQYERFAFVDMLEEIEQFEEWN